MLSILSIDICASYLPWYTFVPILSQSMVVYGVLSPDLNVLCILYSLVYVPGVFVTGKMLSNLGCRKCFILATACLAMGCAMRCGPDVLAEATKGVGTLLALGSVVASSANEEHSLTSAAAAPFPLLMAGQGLCAVGQTFLVNATSELAAEWFPPDERPAASMISNLMNFVGACMSFMVPTWYVSSDSSQSLETTRAQVGELLLLQLKVALLSLALTAAFYRDAPTSQEGGRRSERAAEKAGASLFLELRQVFALRDFWLVNGQFVIYLTVQNTFDAVEGALLMNYGYSEALTSWTAVSFCFSSILSTGIEAVLIRHPAHYCRALMSINGLLAVSCMLGLWCLCERLPAACFVCVVGIMGFSTPGWGCSVEMGSEVCYPAREATVSSLLEAFGSLASVGGIVIAQWLIDVGWAGLVLLAMAVASLAGSFILMGLSGRLRRREAEDKEETLACEDLAHEQAEDGGASLQLQLPLSPSAARSWLSRRRRRPFSEAELQHV